MNRFDLVRKCGKIVSATGADRALLRLHGLLRRNNYLRAVIYHGTPEGHAHSLEKQFQFYQKHFSPVTENDLKNYLQEGRWDKAKPGLLPTFDDGFKSNDTVARPLLEKYGFTGWFFIPTGRVGAPDQMSWEEIRRLDRKHVIGCHTRSHRRMEEGLSAKILQEEIVASKKDLERELGHAVASFCWVGGELQTYTAGAHALIQKAGYSRAFRTNSKIIRPSTSPYALDRTYVEPHWSVNEVAFMISGIIDWLYAKKRKQIARRLGEIS